MADRRRIGPRRTPGIAHVLVFVLALCFVAGRHLLTERGALRVRVAEAEAKAAAEASLARELEARLAALVRERDAAQLAAAAARRWALQLGAAAIAGALAVACLAALAVRCNQLGASNCPRTSHQSSRARACKQRAAELAACRGSVAALQDALASKQQLVGELEKYAATLERGFGAASSQLQKARLDMRSLRADCEALKAQLVALVAAEPDATPSPLFFSWQSSLLPADWAPGGGVLVREDPRMALVSSLACDAIKVPAVMVVTVDGGRAAVAASRGLAALGPSDWLPAFWAWLASQDLSKPLVITDADADICSAEQPWVACSPSIRFLAACSIGASEGMVTGTLVGLDTRPRDDGAAGAGVILAKLAGMVVRELEGPPPTDAGEYWVSNTRVPARLRCRLDAYGCTTLLLDTSEPAWRLLYANAAFQSMTGVPAGCLEGHCFWELFGLQQPRKQEPWQVCRMELKWGDVFQLPPLLFKRATSALKSTQLFRVEMRPYNAETAEAFEVDLPETGSQLWLASFQPDSRHSVELGSPATRDIPFAGLELGPVIGKGSFGCVRRGALGYLPVAVKVIEGNEAAEGMPLVAALAYKLRHPHVVQTIDCATRPCRDQLRPPSSSQRSTSAAGSGSPVSPSSSDGSQPSSAMGSAHLSAGSDGGAGGTPEAWIIMEHCDSGSLRDGIENDCFSVRLAVGEPRQPDIEAIEATAYEIASAMRYLHRHNILHGDLTASNVLLASAAVTPRDRRGFVAKVSDFWLSREAVMSTMATISNGAATHMPPELLNTQVLCKKADVYAFGVLLVEMYTGERVFTGMRHPHIDHTITGQHSRLQLPPDAPLHLAELAEDCMQEAYRQRPTFDEIMDRLRPRLEAHGR